MITVSDKGKYVCIWGIDTGIDANTISTYKSKGYTIVNMRNGTDSIRECMKTVIVSINNT